MADLMVMYDDTEQTTTRYIGFVGDHARYDLMITTTGHFFGKSIVMNLQTARAAILNKDEVQDTDYLAEAFAISIQEAEELSDFLYNSIG